MRRSRKENYLQPLLLPGRISASIFLRFAKIEVMSLAKKLSDVLRKSENQFKTLMIFDSELKNVTVLIETLQTKHPNAIDQTQAK